MAGNWVIAGEGHDARPKVGATYDVRHSRKGRFVLRATSVNGEWLTGVIVAGVADAVMSYNVAGEGDEITIRDSQCYLTSRPPPPGAGDTTKAGNDGKEQP